MKPIYFLIFLLMLPITQAYTLEVLETNPSPVRAGEYADVTVRLQSSSIDAQGSGPVNFYVRSTDDIRPIAGQEGEYTNLGPRQSVTKTFRIFFGEDLPAGNVPVRFVVEVEGVPLIYVRDIFVKGSLRIPELYIGSIESVPDELLPDTKKNRLTVVIQNLGEKDAELLTAELIDVDDNIAESNAYSMRDNIAKLEGGEEEQLEFTFDIEETSDEVIDASLRLRFRTLDELTNSFQIVNENLDLEIPLARAPELSIIKVEPREEVLVGKQENEVIVTVVNTGKEDAESVRLRLYPDPSQPFDFEKNNYFLTPRLEIGENASVIIMFDVLEDAVIQDYNFDVELESIVGSSRKIEQDTLKMEVTGEQLEGLSLVRLGIIIIAVTTALLIGFYSFKAKK